MMSNISMDWLKGVRVLLIAHYIPGPTAAYLLRGLGAEVIKVEPPFGDMMRGIPPFITTKNQKTSAYFRAFNGGFKSIVLNFKKEKDIVSLKKLIKKANVIIDGNRRGYLEKLVGNIAEINSDIIHIPITAYGLSGPYKDIAGHDSNILSVTGALSYNSLTKEEVPAIVGTQIVDLTVGYLAALVAVSALFATKNKTRNAITTADVSMLHAAFSLNHMYTTAMTSTGTSPLPGKETFNGALPNYRMYKTKDGKGIFFGPVEHKLFRLFCERLHRMDVFEIVDSNPSKCKEELTAIFLSKTGEEWIREMEGCDCCLTVVNTLAEALENEQIKALYLINEIDDEKLGKVLVNGYPFGFTSESHQPILPLAAPELGEHTDEILRMIENP